MSTSHTSTTASTSSRHVNLASLTPDQHRLVLALVAAAESGTNADVPAAPDAGEAESAPAPPPAKRRWHAWTEAELAAARRENAKRKAARAERATARKGGTASK